MSQVLPFSPAKLYPKHPHFGVRTAPSEKKWGWLPSIPMMRNQPRATEYHDTWSELRDRNPAAPDLEHNNRQFEKAIQSIMDHHSRVWFGITAIPVLSTLALLAVYVGEECIKIPKVRSDLSKLAKDCYAPLFQTTTGATLFPEESPFGCPTVYSDLYGNVTEQEINPKKSTLHSTSGSSISTFFPTDTCNHTFSVATHVNASGEADPYPYVGIFQNNGTARNLYPSNVARQVFEAHLKDQYNVPFPCFDGTEYTADRIMIGDGIYATQATDEQLGNLVINNPSSSEGLGTQPISSPTGGGYAEPAPQYPDLEAVALFSYLQK